MKAIFKSRFSATIIEGEVLSYAYGRLLMVMANGETITATEYNDGWMIGGYAYDVTIDANRSGVGERQEAQKTGEL